MKKYSEIFKLASMLLADNIPFKFINIYDGYQILLYNDNGSTLADAVQHMGSYGHENDLIEIMGGLTPTEEEESSVCGWLTADEVYARFKYCYENNTSKYPDLIEGVQ